jgi:predicted enzyme related to lactoylglutathione lyase
MSVVVDCVCVEVADIREAINFFNDKLGIVCNADWAAHNKRDFLVPMTGQPDIMLVECVGKVRPTTITLKTADCIECYYQMKTRGLLFHQLPQYLPYGLCASFRDPSGNEYQLFEERNYAGEFVA